jgi:hypothetical protein
MVTTRKPSVKASIKRLREVLLNTSWSTDYQDEIAGDLAKLLDEYILHSVTVQYGKKGR